MNKDELARILTSERISPSAYSLDGGLPSEQLVLSHDGNGRWSVYYSERGVRTGEVKFRTESEACEHLLRLLRNNPTTRMR